MTMVKFDTDKRGRTLAIIDDCIPCVPGTSIEYYFDGIGATKEEAFINLKKLVEEVTTALKLAITQAE